MKKVALIIILLTGFASVSHAQFWFGPILGGHLSSSNFLEDARRDTFDIAPRLGWHAGLAMDYSTESAFEVHTELRFTRVVHRTILEQDGFTLIDSKFSHNFLTFPAMARVVLFKRSRVKFMGEAGVQLSYWLGGKGELLADELLQFDDVNQVDVDIVFRDDLPENLSDLVGQNSLIVTKPNRLQYSLGIGFGAIYDITPEQRFIIDAKYMFGHSIMGFNDGNVLNALTTDIYTEDLEYRVNIFTVSAAYMFGWNPVLNRKGRSTSKIGKKKKK